MTDLTIIIPYRDEKKALARLLTTLPVDLPVIVVDDVSAIEPVVDGRARIIRLPERGYFSGAVNAGLAACDTDVLICNQDIWFNNEHWLSELDRLRHEYAVIGHGVMKHPAWPTGYVQGTLMFLRRDAITATGPFNAEDFPLWGATAEWQVRACRHGFRVLPMGDLPWFEHERKGDYGKSITAALGDEPDKRDLFIRTPPLVSVVIPCFNYGKYLPDAVNSLIGGQTCLGQHPGQTFQAFEVVIVDDQSTDDSWQIAQSLADPWKGIRAIRLAQNSGTAEAMNAGIRTSYGRFIQALDADDMLEPEALETAYDILQEYPNRVIYTDEQIVVAGKRATKITDGRTVPDVWAMQEYDFDELLHRNQVPAGIMFSRKGWAHAGGYPGVMRWGRQDWAFAVALGRAGYCGQHVNQPLYLYRREGQNRTLRNSDEHWRQTFVQQLRELFPDLYRGERPMGCCGGRARRTQPQTAPRAGTRPAATLAAPRDNMVMLEYIGQNAGNTSWWGPATETHYRFGPARRIGYVYESDMDGLLAARIGRRPQFRHYVKPEAAPVVVEEAKPVVVEQQSGPEEADAVATVIVAIADEKPKRRRSHKRADPA